METFKAQLAFVLLANIANSVVLNQLFPYVGMLVEHFGLAGRSTTGYYAGWLTFAIMIGRTAGSPLWGWVTDRFGRKPALVYSLWMVSSASLGLGMATSLPLALLFRFLTGFLNSVLITTKTLVSELCPENYQAQGMAWYSLTRHIGMVVGTVAGTLADPIYSRWLPGWLISEHPFLLPNAISAAMCAIAAIGIQVFVTETLEKSDLSEPLLGKTEDKHTYWELLKDNTVMLTIVLYSLSCSVNSAIVDLIPVWSWAQLEHGGLELSITTIGYLTITANIVMALLQQVFFAPLVAAKGYVWVRLCGCLCIIPATLMLPTARFFVGWTSIFWPYLIIAVSLWYLFMYQIFTVEFVLINNSVTKRQRGKVNGLAMSISSMSRAAACPATTSLFAATATSGAGFPFDFTCAFSANAIVCLITYFMTLGLPSTIERPKDVYSCTKPNEKIDTPLPPEAPVQRS